MFAGSLLAETLETLTTLGHDAGVAVTLIVTVAEPPPAARLPRLQEIVLPAPIAAQEPCDGVTELTVSESARSSVTVTFSAASVPMFVAVSV